MPRPPVWVAVGLAVASGGVLALALPPFAWAWLGWVGLGLLSLVPVVVVLHWREALFCGWLAGLVFYLTSLAWLTEVHVVGWLALGAYLSLYPSLWFLGWWALWRDRPAILGNREVLWRSLAGAGGWVVLEFIRSHLWGGFSWNGLAVTQVPVLSIIQIADLGGIWMVSWLVAFTSIVLALTLVRLWLEATGRQRLRVHADFALAMFLVALAFVYGAGRLIDHSKQMDSSSADTLTFVAVQPDLMQGPYEPPVPVAEAVEILERLTRLGLGHVQRLGAGMKLDASTSRVLVVWPEMPLHDDVYLPGATRRLIDRLIAEDGVALLTGSITFEPGGLFNTAALFEPDQDEPQRLDKVRLVPFGEFLPLADWFPILRDWIPIANDFTPGREIKVLRLMAPPLRLGILICFEDTISDHARDLAQHFPDVWINLTNDGWFGRSAASVQHAHNAVFRAVEHRLPMLRVTNNGITAAYSSVGMSMPFLAAAGSSDPQGRAVFIGQLPLENSRQLTLYGRWGDWWVGVSLVMALGGGVWAWWRRCVSYEAK